MNGRAEGGRNGIVEVWMGSGGGGSGWVWVEALRDYGWERVKM